MGLVDAVFTTPRAANCGWTVRAARVLIDAERRQVELLVRAWPPSGVQPVQAARLSGSDATGYGDGLQGTDSGFV